MITGTPKFNGIVVATISIDFTNPTTKMEAKAAFVDNGTGHTHGWTSGSSWSTETMNRLSELRASMEADLATMHFQGAGSVSMDAAARQGGAVSRGGLAEHLGTSEEDASPI
jgi:hypothetical protein